MKLFKNIEKSIKSAPVQKGELKKVRAKKAGRPPKLNVKRYVFKLDETLHYRMRQKAQELGLPNSGVVSMLLHQWLRAEGRSKG